MTATTRSMMTRMVLHGITTVFALWVSFRLIAEAEMWMRMTMYACAWLACAGAYFLLLYCRQFVLDAVDERIRIIVRDERMADEMRRYARRLRFIARWGSERRPKDD